jgi:hypothetical protein
VAEDASPPLPDGAWEPDPGTGRTSGRLVGDGSNVWFAYARSDGASSDVVLIKTTETGTVLVPPTVVDTTDLSAWPLTIARSRDNIAIVYQESAGTMPPRLRMYDPSGQPLRDAGHPIPISTLDGEHITNVALAAAANGSMHLVATYDRSDMTTELATVKLDASGDPAAAAVLFGTADGGTPTGLSAVVEADDGVRVAWDRRYNYCAGFHDPDATLTTRFDAGGDMVSVVDIDAFGYPDRDPNLAAAGGTSYLVWSGFSDAGSAIRVARASNPSLAIADLGIVPFGNRTPMVTLAEPGRGAIVWRTDEPALRIVSFRDDGTSLVAGPEHAVSFEPNTPFTLRGIAHVGDERYVVSWTDDSIGPSESRLVAITIDLASKPKQVDAPAVAPPMPDQQRCSH